MAIHHLNFERESTSLQQNTQTHLFGIANFVADAIAESSQ